VKARRLNKMDQMDNQELISALADGQLQGEAFAQGVQAATADARARATWCAYQVTSEVLRSGRASAGTPHDAFLAKLQQRLAAEPKIEMAKAPAPIAVRAPEQAANDWRWKLVAGFASVAAVAAVGWNVWGVANPAAQPQLAAAQVANPAFIEASTVPMIRDQRLDRLLAAHRQLGGATALANSSGFLRNATFEGPSR
jgi:sigma-E factor negative regulatory protein RseA